MTFLGGPNARITNPRWRMTARLKIEKLPYQAWLRFDQSGLNLEWGLMSTIKILDFTKIQDVGQRDFE